MRRRGALRGLAREGRSKYSEKQLHAGLATSPKVPARGARPGAGSYRVRDHHSGLDRPGLLHLARGQVTRAAQTNRRFIDNAMDSRVATSHERMTEGKPICTAQRLAWRDI